MDQEVTASQPAARAEQRASARRVSRVLTRLMASGVMAARRVVVRAWSSAYKAAVPISTTGPGWRLSTVLGCRLEFGLVEATSDSSLRVPSGGNRARCGRDVEGFDEPRQQ